MASAAVTSGDNSPASTPTSLASICQGYVLIRSVHEYETLLGVLDDVGAGTCELAKYARVWANALRTILELSKRETKCECEAEKAKNLFEAAHVLAAAPLADVIAASSNSSNVQRLTAEMDKLQLMIVGLQSTIKMSGEVVSELLTTITQHQAMITELKSSINARDAVTVTNAFVDFLKLLVVNEHRPRDAPNYRWDNLCAISSREKIFELEAKLLDLTADDLSHVGTFVDNRNDAVHIIEMSTERAIMLLPSLNLCSNEEEALTKVLKAVGARFQATAYVEYARQALASSFCPVKSTTTCLHWQTFDWKHLQTLTPPPGLRGPCKILDSAATMRELIEWLPAPLTNKVTGTDDVVLTKEGEALADLIDRVAAHRELATWIEFVRRVACEEAESATRTRKFGRKARLQITNDQLIQQITTVFGLAKNDWTIVQHLRSPDGMAAAKITVSAETAKSMIDKLPHCWTQACSALKSLINAVDVYRKKDSTPSISSAQPLP